MLETGRVAPMEKKNRTVLKFGKSKGLTYLRNQSSVGKIILKYVLENKCINLFSGSGCHSKGSRILRQSKRQIIS